jgi:hypothetical protein
MNKRGDEREIRLRIVVRNPVVGVSYALQRGRSTIDFSSIATGADIAFEFMVHALPGMDSRPRLLGDYVQGPPAARFVYVNSGTCAGQPGSCWTRRAKVPLYGIIADLIDRASAGPIVILQTSILGTARDGGPACATVPLLDGGWKIASALVAPDS